MEIEIVAAAACGSSRPRRPRTARCRAAPRRLGRSRASTVMMCCRKLSCLFEVVTKKSCAVVILALALDLAVVTDDLVALLLAERRIGQDHIVASCRRRRAARPALDDRAVAVPRCRADRGSSRKPHDLGHDIDAGELVSSAPNRRRGRAPSACCFMCSQAASRKPAVPQAGSWTVSIRLGVDDLHHRLDQRARREILARAGFHLLRRCVRAGLRRCALHVDRQAEPGLAVDQADEALAVWPGPGSRSVLSGRSRR